MKHLKKFENFYLNDVPREDEEIDEQDYLDRVRPMTEVSPDDEDCDPSVEDCEDEDEDSVPRRRRVWGDEVDEKKKYSKKESDDSPKSAVKLTAKQKRLPKSLQDAILRRKKK